LKKKSSRLNIPYEAYILEEPCSLLAHQIFVLQIIYISYEAYILKEPYSLLAHWIFVL
ncbi:hypothetical protein AOQ84DRAFT_381191, partial [Glonium stellatum]